MQLKPETIRDLERRGIRIPTELPVMLSVDIAPIARRLSKYPDLPVSTVFDEMRSSNSLFLMESLYRLAWTTIDRFGDEEDDPRLHPLLDLIEIIQSAKPVV